MGDCTCACHNFDVVVFTFHDFSPGARYRNISERGGGGGGALAYHQFVFRLGGSIIPHITVRVYGINDIPLVATTALK